VLRGLHVWRCEGLTCALACLQRLLLLRRELRVPRGRRVRQQRLRHARDGQQHGGVAALPVPGISLAVMQQRLKVAPFE